LAINREGVPRTIITIGASGGGVEALRALFSNLPVDLPAAVAAVIHRSPGYASTLAPVLGRRALMPVKEATDGEPIETGRVYIAPADMHLMIEPHRFRLERGAKEHFTRPAVDPLFRSAAAAYGRRVVGVVLSGSGQDGVSGLIAIKAAGGLCLVQHPGEAPFPGMPVNAITYDHVDGVLPLDLIPGVLVTLANGGVVDDAAETAAAR
jgi:two-component system chemotaxis response regulator CheB